MPESAIQALELDTSVDKESQRIFRMVGLVIENLEGKTVLDVGAGNRTLERIAKARDIDTTIVSYDIDQNALQYKREEKDRAVRGDFWKGLPFKDNFFDTVISVGGPIGGGPWSDSAIASYLQGLRVIRDDGEIRVSNPFGHEGGVGSYFYVLAKEGVIVISDSDVEEEYANRMISRFDDDGFPEEESYFWHRYYAQFSRSEQIDFQRSLADGLEDMIKKEGLTVNITLYDRDPQEILYTPYMVMRKFS